MIAGPKAEHTAILIEVAATLSILHRINHAGSNRGQDALYSRAGSPSEGVLLSTRLSECSPSGERKLVSWKPPLGTPWRGRSGNTSLPCGTVMAGRSGAARRARAGRPRSVHHARPKRDSGPKASSPDQVSILPSIGLLERPRSGAGSRTEGVPPSTAARALAAQAEAP